MPYTITTHEHPDPAEIRILGDGLVKFGNAIFGSTEQGEIAFFVRDEDGKVVGGIHGYHGSFGWLYIDTLWVSDEIRGKGFGRQLIELIEDEALKHDCPNIYLNTFSFQAPEFYKKLGYTVFGELENFPEGHTRLFLKKSLA